MSDIDAARKAILDLGAEDYYHLADAAAYLPSVAADRRMSVARQALRQLLREGLVQLYFGRIAINEVTPVNLNDALLAVDDPRAWDLEDRSPGVYCFLNTEAGDAVYRGNAGPASA